MWEINVCIEMKVLQERKVELDGIVLIGWGHIPPCCSCRVEQSMTWLSLSHFALLLSIPPLWKIAQVRHTSIHTQKQWQQCCCSHKLENYPRTEQTLFGSRLGNCPPDHWFLLCQDFSPGNGSLKFKTLCFPNQHFHFQTCFLSLSLSLCAAVLTDLTTLIHSLTHSLTHSLLWHR
jgi:hypothetical protein